MAKLTVKTGGKQMPALTEWRPFEALHREIDSLFDNFDGGFWRFPFGRSVFDVEPLGRREDIGDVTAVQAIGRQEFAGEDRCVEKQQEAARPHRQSVAAKAPPHHDPLRGEVESLLLRCQLLDRLGIEGRRRHHVRYRRALRLGVRLRPLAVGHGRARLAERRRGGRTRRHPCQGAGSSQKTSGR